MLKHTYSLVWSTQSRPAEADVENEGVAHVLLVSMWHMSEKSSRSTLNTAVSSPVQWPQADRSVWPHRSLRRSPSTPAQRESGCCSSCTDRPSPGAQRCSPETCFSRSASQLRLQSDGKPLLATHTSVAVFFEEISALEGGRTLTLGRVTPDKHTRVNSVKNKAFLSFQVQKNRY